jgi:hypothetical protein
MRTPPIEGSTAFSISASFISSCPTIAENGYEGGAEKLAWRTFSCLERLVVWDRKVRFFIPDAILLAEKYDASKPKHRRSASLNFANNCC